MEIYVTVLLILTFLAHLWPNPFYDEVYSPHRQYEAAIILTLHGINKWQSDRLASYYVSCLEEGIACDRLLQVH